MVPDRGTLARCLADTPGPSYVKFGGRSRQSLTLRLRPAAHVVLTELRFQRHKLLVGQDRAFPQLVQLIRAEIRRARCSCIGGSALWRSCRDALTSQPWGKESEQGGHRLLANGEAAGLAAQVRNHGRLVH